MPKLKTIPTEMFIFLILALFCQFSLIENCLSKKSTQNIPTQSGSGSNNNVPFNNNPTTHNPNQGIK